MHASTKRIAYSALLALLILGISGPSAQAQVGIAAGANFDSLGDIETTTNTSQNETLDNATGYHVGIVYNLGLGPINLKPGILYRKVGSYDFSDVQGANVDEVDVTAFEVPVDIEVTLLPTPLVRPYVLGGPNLFLPRSSDDSFDEGLEEVAFNFNVGVGAGISVPGIGMTLSPELRYEFGATNYVDDFSVGDTDFNPSDRKLSAFALRLNVLF